MHGFVSGHPPSGVSLLVLADVVVVVVVDVVDDVDLLFLVTPSLWRPNTLRLVFCALCLSIGGRDTGRCLLSPGPLEPQGASPPCWQQQSVLLYLVTRGSLATVKMPPPPKKKEKEG